MKPRINSSFLILAITCAVLMACGKKADPMSPTSSVNNADAFAAQTLGNIKWDGEGTEFSGNYTFSFSESTLKCPSVRDINFPAAAAVYKCTQKDALFACGKPTEETGSESFQGHISKEGKFMLMHVTMGPNQATAVSGLRDGEVKTFLAGTINTDNGQAQYSMIQQNAQRQGACISSAKLSVQVSN